MPSWQTIHCVFHKEVEKYTSEHERKGEGEKEKREEGGGGREREKIHYQGTTNVSQNIKFKQTLQEKKEQKKLPYLL